MESDEGSNKVGEGSAQSGASGRGDPRGRRRAGGAPRGMSEGIRWGSGGGVRPLRYACNMIAITYCRKPFY